MSAIFGFTFHMGRMTEVLTPYIYRAHWPAAHESYLLSKNSLVTISVGKFSQCAATFNGFCSRVSSKNGTRDQPMLLKRRRTLREHASPNSHE